MPSDSDYVNNSSKNRSSWEPKHSLSLNIPISTSMSKHLHSTTRRIFIGPTPVNWSYKKSSLWFPKSDQAVHHKGPNRQRTFRAEPEVKGPADLSSLNFCEVVDNPALIRLTDKPFLVSEPEEISMHHESENSLFNNEIFYTPNEEIRPLPVTPPHKHWRSVPETFFQENPFNDAKQMSHFNFVSTPIDHTSDDDLHTGSSSSGFSHSNSDLNYSEIEYIHDNAVKKRRSSNVVDHSAQFTGLDNPESHELHPVSKFGSIIKEGRMLIRIERLYHRGTPKRYSGHFVKGHASRKYLVQSVGWREYVVKLHSTGMLELYGKKKDRFAKIKITEQSRLTLFSTIDYTFSLKRQTSYGMKVFLMNPKTLEQSIEWYRALYTTFGEPLVKPMPSVCEVYVPDLDVHVKIPLEKSSQAYQITAEDVTKLVLDELNGEPEWDNILHEWLKSCDLRLCWKRYDRLEWIVWEKNEEGKVRNDLLACPQFIEGTHQLQLRPTEHYPNSVHLNDETKLYEPPPVDGYLIRVTNNKGKLKPKRLYFTSHDHYLFFLKPLAASPPPPPTSLSSISCDENRQNTHPLIYAVAPQSQEQYAQTGVFMKADAKRRVKQILNAIAFINLVDVVEVRDTDISLGYKITEIENHGCPFELVLNNGRNVILQAYSRQTTDEWVKRLKELVTYWKARVKSDIQIRNDMFKTNENYPHDDDDDTSQDELRIHWNNLQAYVDPTIWNWCILNGCRAITKGGLFYHKSHIHGTFKNYYHILTRGHLLYYKLHTRKLLDGAATRQSFYKRCGCINLADCYTYSGSITEYDLLYSSSLRFSPINDETHKLPRIYSDGMCCFDNDDNCTFVIWQGKQKLYFGKSENKKGYLKKKIMLDQPGNIWVFRTRSRLEREEWVWAINMEIERACKMTEQK